jgi:hypothetical protein
VNVAMKGQMTLEQLLLQDKYLLRVRLARMVSKQSSRPVNDSFGCVKRILS